MQKYLVVDYEKCTGCRLCEIVCSLKNKGECNPAKSAIHIIKWEAEGIDVPMLCQQCETALCEAACPVAGAVFSRHPATGAVLIDEARCLGCRMCIVACPIGGASVDPDTRRIIKCNFCDGDPECVKVCEVEAIQYLPVTQITYMKKLAGAERLAEVIRTSVAVKE